MGDKFIQIWDAGSGNSISKMDLGSQPYSKNLVFSDDSVSPGLWPG